MEIIKDSNEQNRLERLREKAQRLPLSPGVYLMRDARKKIIYIGKAKALKNRVSQYFRNLSSHTDKVRQMVSNVEDFEYIICDSEFEALILECSLIKQYSPKYNILLKDDKGYHYIKISKGGWPTIKAVKKIEDDGAEYIGPYNSAFVVKQTVDEALKIFKLPQCNKVFPRDYKKSRPCLNFHIGACSAPCAGKISYEDYFESVNEAVEFIKGGNQASIKDLKARMEQAAENLEFEKAARLRDRIRALERINQKQKVINSSYKRQDIIALAQGSESACFEVFIFKNFKLSDREQFIIDTVEDALAARAEFIRRYYSMRDEVPPRIAVDGDFEDKELLKEWLSQKAGRKVIIINPQRGSQKALVEMCRKNAAEYLAEKSGKSGRETAALGELARLLGLAAPPKFIEAYDISNIAGTENVAGMVVFCDGKPLKSAYRKFKIRGVAGQDDYKSLQEVIDRRFAEYEAHKVEQEGFGRLPDLILIDGGHGQLNAVCEVLERRNIDIPVFGMVKDSKHKTRAIAANGGDISIKSNRQAYTLISTIQEEVHRFAISYHRQRRKRATFKSGLLEIPGVGEKTAGTLLKHFKTIKAIKSASLEELTNVKGINKRQAESIYSFFYNNKDGAEK
ncbi:MAG TPA: excinuclease ABC subunit UvrC [Clostridiales bacterium]|nr:excinuclease ABC subunit UvrC [Clostridiales bacterium]